MELYSAGKKNPGCRRGRLNAQREGGARGFRAALMIVNCVAGRYSAIVNLLSLNGDRGSLPCYDPDDSGRGNWIDLSDFPTSVCGFSLTPNSCRTKMRASERSVDPFSPFVVQSILN